MSKKKDAPREDPAIRRMTATERRTFLEMHLREESDVARRELEVHAFESFRDVVKDLRVRAFEIREGERVFGRTHFTDFVARRMERWADKLELHVERRLWEFAEKRRLRDAGVTARSIRRQKRETEARSRLEVALAEAERQAVEADARLLMEGGRQCKTQVKDETGQPRQCTRAWGHMGLHRIPNPSVPRT